MTSTDYSLSYSLHTLPNLYLFKFGAIGKCFHSDAGDRVGDCGSAKLGVREGIVPNLLQTLRQFDRCEMGAASKRFFPDLFKGRW